MNYEDSPEFKSWKRRVEVELIPKLKASGATVSLLPEGAWDVKFSVELGLSIMMDKPILVVVRPGTKLPNKLVKVADLIVEGDTSTEEGMRKVRDAVVKFAEDHD